MQNQIIWHHRLFISYHRPSQNPNELVTGRAQMAAQLVCGSECVLSAPGPARPAISENPYFRFRNTCRGDTRKSQLALFWGDACKTRNTLLSSELGAVPYAPVINNQNAQTSQSVPVTRSYDHDSWNLLLFLLLDADLYFEECHLRFCYASKWRIAVQAP